MLSIHPDGTGQYLRREHGDREQHAGSSLLDSHFDSSRSRIGHSAQCSGFRHSPSGSRHVGSDLKLPALQYKDLQRFRLHQQQPVSVPRRRDKAGTLMGTADLQLLRADSHLAQAYSCKPADCPHLLRQHSGYSHSGHNHLDSNCVVVQTLWDYSHSGSSPQL